MRSLVRRPLAGGAAAAVAAAAVLIPMAGQAAASSAPITLKYPVTGSTVLKSVNATVKLGPGTLTSTVDLNTGDVSANLALPPATASFRQLGLIPVTATTEFIQDGATTGKLNLNTGAIKTTSNVTLKITSLKVAGLPVPVGSNCQTSTPAQVTVKSQKGFNVINGGNLAGTYTVPTFAHCGLATALINLTIPGAGNTITLTLGKAKRVG